MDSTTLSQDVFRNLQHATGICLKTQGKEAGNSTTMTIVQTCSVFCFFLLGKRGPNTPSQHKEDISCRKRGCNGQSETSRSLESVCQLDKCQLSAVPVVEGTENNNLITISRAQLHGNLHGIRTPNISWIRNSFH